MLTATPEPYNIPDTVHVDLRQVHQSARELEARKRRDGWTYPASTGQPLAGIFGGHPRQAWNCKSFGARAHYGLGNEPNRWSALPESCV